MKNKKLVILLADSNITNIELFQRTLILLNLNCELLIFEDGEALINHINSNNTAPNYIFLDVNLPIIDGLTCLSYIKTKHPSNTFFIIMTTNNLCQNTLNNCYRFGASCIIDKNIEEDNFINIINYCFKKMHTTVFEKEFELNRIVSKTDKLEIVE